MRLPWLENAVERAVILCTGDRITRQKLPQVIFSSPPTLASHQSDGSEGTFSLNDLSLDKLERLAIEETLCQTSDNKSEAARRLGITRATLHNKLCRYGME